MHASLEAATALATLALATGALAQMTLYESADYQGLAVTATQQVADLGRTRFNDRTSSATVIGTAWEACENTDFGGRCRVLLPGRYPSLQAMGLNDRLTSLRPLAHGARIDVQRHAPPVEAARDSRPLASERLHLADVTAVHAVVAKPGQRRSGDTAAAHQGSWDVSYRFRGQLHQVQMSTPPGRTVSVNDRGEPRV